MSPSRQRWLLVTLVCLLGCAVFAHAQLFKYPEQLDPLKLDANGSNSWNVEVTKLTPTSGILYPGDTVSLQLTLSNTGNTALIGAPTVEIVHVDAKFEGFDGTRGDMMIGGFKMRTVPLAPADRFMQPAVNIDPGKTATLTWMQTDPKAYAKFGLYAVVVDIPGKGRQGVGSFARVYPPNPAAGDGKDSPLLYSQNIWYMWGPQQLDAVARLGYKWVRTDGFPNWNGVATRNHNDGPDGPFDWTNTDAQIEHYRRNHLWIMSNMYGGPEGAVTDANRKAYNMIHQPIYDDTWGMFVEEAVRRYCGKDGNGPLQIIDYYNEPWEGGGISGWKSDAFRYRTIYKIIYDRAHLASPFIKVGGSSSIMNTEDKFFSLKDWQKDYKFDVLTDHYVQPYACWGPRVAQKLGIISIETETWMGSSPDRLVATCSHFLAAGQKKVTPNHPEQLMWKNGEIMCRPTAVAANAFLNFTAGRSFTRIAFTDHLPWLYQFGSDTNCCFILAGDRSMINPDTVTMYDQIKADGVLTMSNLGGKLKVYDIYGNLYPAKAGNYTLPCGFTSVYLEAPGLTAAQVIAAVQAARLEKVKPVEFFADDFVTPIADAKTIDVDVHNVLNRTIVGAVTVTTPATITLAQQTFPVTLRPGETRTLQLPIKSAVVNPANAYTFTFHFAGADGTADLRDVLEVNTLAYGTPALDGSQTGWEKAVPVLVHGADLKRDLSETAWRPWEQEKDVTKGLAEVRFMWDERNIYLCVRDRNADWTPKATLAHRNDDALFGKDDMAHTYIGNIWDSLPGSGHCLQLAFNLGQRTQLLPNYPAVPAKMIVQADTDYEYDIWKTLEGRDEIFRSAAPNLTFLNFLPRCEPQGYNGIPDGARVKITREGIDTTYQIAIPRADMPQLVPQAAKGLKLTFALPGSGIFFGTGRSRTRLNALTLLPTWSPTPSNDIRWGFTK